MISPPNLDTDITIASRYECKYIVSPMLVPQIREFIDPFMMMDRLAQTSDGLHYPICSLYCDTDDMRLYNQTVCGEKKRFKVRVRTYSDDPESPAFLEIKRRVNGIVNKRRAPLDRERAAEVLRRGTNGWLEELPAELGRDVEYFAAHMSLACAKPIVRVKYLREAYESRGGDPVRVTLDTDLQHAVTLNDDLRHASGRWVSTPVQGVILELKFTNRYPPWIGDLVRVFGLKQIPVPKYVMSLDHVFMAGREGVLAAAGFMLPPRRG